MSLYLDPPHIKIAKAVAARLQEWTDLTGFFGARITTLSLAEAENPIRRPLLAVIPQIGPEKRVVGGDVEADVPVLIRCYLPYPTRATQEIAAPIAPTSAPVAAAAAASFRLSEFGPRGQSFAGPPVTSTVGATLTLPTKASGSDGFLVWRTPAGLTRYHWAGVARQTTWVDSRTDAALGDELAPDFDLGFSIITAVGCALHGVDIEQLHVAGYPLGYGFVTGKRSVPKIVVDRNLVLYEYVITNQTRFNPTTGEINLNGDE